VLLGCGSAPGAASRAGRRQADGDRRYRAVAVHPSPELRKQHEEMGFHEGWATVLDQLVEVAKTL
jgi:uncharacterized protein YndB with AHSA1/START domain